MEPIKFIIPAIIILSILLVVVLVYTIHQSRRDRQIQRELKAKTAARPEFVKTPSRPTHVPAPVDDPMLQQVRQALESQNPGADAAEAAKATARGLEPGRSTLRPDDRTPPAGNPAVEVSNLLNDKEASPRWNNESFVTPDAKTRSNNATTAPQPTVSNVVERDDAPKPPKKQTVALNRPFFEDDAPVIPSVAPVENRSSGMAPSEKEEEDILSVLSPQTSAPVPQAPSPVAAPPVSPTRPMPAPPVGSRPPAPTTRPNPALARPTPPVARPAAPAAPRAESAARSAMTAALNRPLTTQIPKVSDAFGLPVEETEPNTAKFRNTSLPVAQRLEAFQNLLKSSEQEERALLIVEAMNDDELEIQLVALQEINARTSNALLDEVIPLIDAPTPQVSIAAIRALESIGGPVVEQALLAALDNANEDVRKEAQRVLVASTNPLLEEQLQEMLAENNPAHIESAARVLSAIGGPEIAELLETRATLLQGNAALQQTLQSLAAFARSTQRKAGSDSLDFANAQEFEFPHSDLDEFSLSLDPELFNPKS